MLLAALPCVRLMKSTWALQAVGACTWGKSVLLSQWEWVAACLSALWLMSASLCRVASSANFTSRKVWSEHSEQSHSIFFIFFIDAVRECESFLNALQRQRKPATFFFAPVGFFSSGADLLLTTVYFNLTPAWRSYLGSLWARGRNSSRLTRERAHLCPRSSQKEAVLRNNYTAPLPTIPSSCHV